MNLRIAHARSSHRRTAAATPVVSSALGAAALVVALLTTVSPATVAAQAPSDYVIGPQDVLAIAVFDQTELSGRYTVETNGSFSFPLVGRVTAAGLTLRQFEKELTTRLADGFFKNPQVTVGIEQYRSQRVFVMGEVRQPGPVALNGGMTLIEALARAGSTLTTASGEVSIVRGAHNSAGPVLPGQEEGDAVVVRVSIKELETGTTAKNVELYDGDTIFVPRAETLYVFGQVRNPGAYAIQKETTVLQALSLAGGVTENGAIGRVRIARIVADQKREFRVKLTDVVEAGDTLIVPERFF